MFFLVVLSMVSLEVTEAQPGTASAASAMARAEVAAPVGAELFADNCSVCHGASGLGLEEARLAFPPDHRDCTHCHKKGNPPTMTFRQIETRQHDLFDVGEPPSLRGEGSMAAHATPDAIRAYISGAMPRYRPGSMTEAEYLAITEFLLALNGR